MCKKFGLHGFTIIGGFLFVGILVSALEDRFECGPPENLQTYFLKSLIGKYENKCVHFPQHFLRLFMILIKIVFFVFILHETKMYKRSKKRDIIDYWKYKLQKYKSKSARKKQLWWMHTLRQYTKRFLSANKMVS